MTASVPQPVALMSASSAQVINHLLAQDSWARGRLAEHAGKTATILATPLQLTFTVCADGLLQAATDDASQAVTIHLKTADLVWLLQDRERALASTRVEGDAEFAHALSQVMQGLRWDAEYDLQRVFGEIAARRIAQAVRESGAQAQSGVRKLQENVAEYLLEEQPMLVRQSAIDDFGQQVGRLRDDVERLEKRIARLLQKAPVAGPQD